MLGVMGGLWCVRCYGGYMRVMVCCYGGYMGFMVC